MISSTYFKTKQSCEKSDVKVYFFHLVTAAIFTLVLTTDSVKPMDIPCGFYEFSGAMWKCQISSFMSNGNYKNLKSISDNNSAHHI